MKTMSFRYVRATLLLLLLTSVKADEDHEHEYTNDFAVEIDGDMSVADLVAGSHSLRVVRHVRAFSVLVAQLAELFSPQYLTLGGLSGLHVWEA